MTRVQENQEEKHLLPRGAPGFSFFLFRDAHPPSIPSPVAKRTIDEASGVAEIGGEAPR